LCPPLPLVRFSPGGGGGDPRRKHQRAAEILAQA